MKTKKILAVIATLTIALNATASDGTEISERKSNEYGNQQVVVNNYYSDNGYEYSSRIKRFHSSFSSFDFYAPVYTETYWYHYTPYTWGVSIYDDWHYYGAGVSRYSWRSGFGGSYWWGFDPMWNSDPWMGYGWNSYYSPGFSYGINLYLGRPQYHYPVAWNRWNHHQHWDYYRPVYIVNNNHYYNTSTNNRNTGYNPSKPYDSGRRSSYTVTSGRSSASTYTRPATTTTRSQESGTRTSTGTSANTGSRGSAGTATNNGYRGNSGTSTNTGSRGNSGAAANNGRVNNSNSGSNNSDKSNNGLRMGQYRRGVAQPTEAKPNEPNRPNNPNVNDRTNPGREQTGVRVPAQNQPQRKTQTTVRTTSQRSETNVNQGSSNSSAKQQKTAVRKSTSSGTVESSEKKSSTNETGRRTTTSTRKR